LMTEIERKEKTGHQKVFLVTVLFVGGDTLFGTSFFLNTHKLSCKQCVYKGSMIEE
jgi:hypothetical protein